VYILCIYFVYIVYIFCIYCVYTVYILCIYCVYIVYILCIYCVYTEYILCIYCVYTVYILCIYCVYIQRNIKKYSFCVQLAAIDFICNLRKWLQGIFYNYGTFLVCAGKNIKLAYWEKNKK